MVLLPLFLASFMTPTPVSIIIPIYRDRLKIGATLDTLVDFFNREKLTGEIIVVNDGGTDGGAEIVRDKLNFHPNIKLLTYSVNRGKGYAVREGLCHARGDFIFYTDADLPYFTEPIKRMLELLQTGTADIIMANRDLEQTQDEKPNWARQLTHIIYSLFVRAFIPIHFTDTLAGLKGMTRGVIDNVVPRLTINRFSFDVEFLLIATKLGYRVHELPVSLKNVGRSNLSIRRDAPEMIKEIIQIWRQLRRGYYG